MSKKIFICQSNYIPWKGYFDAINQADVFVVYDEMQYTKNDWRNRNKIKTPNGVQWLTIPIQYKFGQKINDTYISQSNWSNKHWKTICQNYSKAPFFSLYKDAFESLYSNIDLLNISDINVKFITEINRLLGIDTKIIRSKDLIFEGDKNERLVQIIKQLNCDHYISGPAAKDYMDLKMFNDNVINVEYLAYSNYPEYHQLFGDFEHGVSILDLLFNKGDDAKNFFNIKN
jgi:glutaredoxin-related protein